jgi:hypothetical protein
MRRAAFVAFLAMINVREQRTCDLSLQPHFTLTKPRIFICRIHRVCTWQTKPDTRFILFLCGTTDTTTDRQETATSLRSQHAPTIIHGEINRTCLPSRVATPHTPPFSLARKFSCRSSSSSTTHSLSIRANSAATPLAAEISLLRAHQPATARPSRFSLSHKSQTAAPPQLARYISRARFPIHRSFGPPGRQNNGTDAHSRRYGGQRHRVR